MTIAPEASGPVDTVDTVGPTEPPLPGSPLPGPRRPRRFRRIAALGSIQTKLLVALLLTSILSALVVGFFGYRSGTKALTDATYARLTEVGSERQRELLDFFANQKGAVLLDSAGVGAQALPAFAGGYSALQDGQLSDARSAALNSWYARTFIPQLKQDTGQTYNVTGFVPRRPAARYLQAAYTTRYASDFEQVAAVDNAGDGSAWSAANARYNPYFRTAQTSLGLDDVLMLNADGDVVYSLYKGAELGTNVLTGPYQGGGLEQVYTQAVRSNSPSSVQIADFEAYQPAFGKPTMFVSSPIARRDGTIAGVLVYEISADKINAVLSGSDVPGRFTGLGRSGEAYVVGPDQTFRSDSRELFDHPDDFRTEAVDAGNDPSAVERMLRLKQTILTLRDTSTAAVLAGRGQSGTLEGTDYLGVESLLSYAPAGIEGLDWSLVTRIDAAEALEPVTDFARNILLATGLVVILVCAASVLLARIFTAPVRRLIDAVHAVAAGGGPIGPEISARQDEFGDLGHAFTDLSDSLVSTRERLAEQSADNQRLVAAIMPAELAQQYRAGSLAPTLSADEVCVLSCRLAGITAWSRTHTPAQARALLTDIGRGFTEAAEQTGIERVRRTGTSFEACSGLIIPREDHARRGVDFALGLGELVQRLNRRHDADLELFAGLAVGKATGGLTDDSSPAWDLWGVPVSRATLLRSRADVPGIYITDTVRERLPGDYELSEVGFVGQGAARLHVWRVCVGSGGAA